LARRKKTSRATYSRKGEIGPQYADFDSRIEFLSSSHLEIVSSIDPLKKCHAELMKELSQVDQELNSEV
jgi:hypothetical protein